MAGYATNELTTSLVPTRFYGQVIIALSLTCRHDLQTLIA